MPNEIQTTMPVMPQTAASDGLFGGGSSWIILLVLILLLGRGGGGLFGGDANTAIGLTNEGLALKNNSDINTATNRIVDNMGAGFAGVNSGICGIQQTLISGFGNLQHHNDLATCRIETAIHAEGEATRAVLRDQEIQALRDRNVEQANAISNLQQTNAIINAIKPCPVPSYLTFPPNAPYMPFGCGCERGW